MTRGRDRAGDASARRARGQRLEELAAMRHVASCVVVPQSRQPDNAPSRGRRRSYALGADCSAAPRACQRVASIIPTLDEPRPRNPLRSLRDRRLARRRRHGRGLPRPRHAARSRRRDQGAARAFATTPTPGALRARGAALAALNHPDIAQIYGVEAAAPAVPARSSWSWSRATTSPSASRAGRCRSTTRCDRAADRRRARSGARAAASSIAT